MSAQLFGLALLLVGPATLVGDPPDPGPRPAGVDDPREWRDNRRPELRRHWDRLEGKPAPSLASLGEWTGRDAADWADLRGKVVLLDYWATWCGPCRAGIPHLMKLQERFADEGLVVLGVHSARGWKDMAKLAQQKKINYALAADKDRQLGKALGVQYLPSYFVIDRAGRMRVAGAERAQLDAIVKGLLAEPAPDGRGDAQDAKPASGAGGAWPEKVEKRLYARDLRGQAAPAFEPTTWLGEKYDLEGKVVVYDMWATWCGPCVQGIPKLNALQKKFKDDLTIVGVSDEEASKIFSFLEKTKVEYALALDGGKLKKAFGVEAIPNVVVVSSDGIVRWQGIPHMPPDELSEETLRRIIEADRAQRAEKIGSR